MASKVERGDMSGRRDALSETFESELLSPRNNSGEVLDYAVITSAYGRRAGNIQNLINGSTIYYINEDKKEPIRG